MTLYRALLRLYPAGYRAEYGDELHATFVQRLRERGRLAPLVGPWAALADVLPNAFLVHLDLLRPIQGHQAGSGVRPRARARRISSARRAISARATLRPKGVTR